METLERVTRVHGKPRTIRVAGGPEFIRKTLDLWAYLNGVSLEDVRSRCEAWRKEHNEIRPHSSIGQKTPSELAKASC